MSAHDHHHDHDGHDHSMSVYQFFGNILGYPLDETLLFNVGDPAFWENLKEKIDNDRTHEALDHVQAAVAQIDLIPEDRRKMALDAEFAQTFLLPDSPMPPLESDYGLQGNEVQDVARKLGAIMSIQRFLPDDHIANELFILAPLDYGTLPSPEQLQILADFFERHPMALLRSMLDHAPGDAPGTGFYRAIVELALACMQWDLDAHEAA